MKKFLALIAAAALLAFAGPALAANPFSDVPMNHWAYDAVAKLAASGIVVGYPDGAFKGGLPATRYEMAAVVARALASMDAKKGSRQDAETLKKLVVEFKNELGALGVKVDKLDSRVAVIEEEIGGWKFSGNFRFTAKWADEHNYWSVDQDSNWKVDRFRWNITRYVDDKVKLYVRLQGAGGEALTVARAYTTIKFPWDVTAAVGRFPLDWESDFYATDFAGYNMNDAFITDYDPLETAFWIKKPFAAGKFEAFLAHNEDDKVSDYYQYGARLAFDVNENLHLALNVVRYDYTNEDDFHTLWGDLIVNFSEGVAFKGQYFLQDLGYNWLWWSLDDSPTAWKAVLTFSQSTLKFTDLWIEYAKMDSGFKFPYSDPYAWALTESIFGRDGYAPYDSTVFNVVAKQMWNERWWTYIRYFDYEGGDEDYKNYTGSVRYNYTPNLWFEVGYDKMDANAKPGDDMMWFRTTVNF